MWKYNCVFIKRYLAAHFYCITLISVFFFLFFYTRTIKWMKIIECYSIFQKDSPIKTCLVVKCQMSLKFYWVVCFQECLSPVTVCPLLKRVSQTHLYGCCSCTRLHYCYSAPLSLPWLLLYLIYPLPCCEECVIYHLNQFDTQKMKSR